MRIRVFQINFEINLSEISLKKMLTTWESIGLGVMSALTINSVIETMKKGKKKRETEEKKEKESGGEGKPAWPDPPQVSVFGRPDHEGPCGVTWDRVTEWDRLLCGQDLVHSLKGGGDKKETD